MQTSTPRRQQTQSWRASRRASRTRARSVSVGTVAVYALDRLIDVGVSAGIRRDILTAAAGVTDADLRDPDARVPLTAEIAVWQTLARYKSDPEFGVQAGATHTVRTMGLLGYVVRFSATLRGALERVQRYGRVFTEAVRVELQERRREVVLAKAHPALGPGQELAESYRLAALLQVSRELTGVEIVPAEVTFTHTQPPRTTAYVRHFRCPLRFHSRVARIVYRKPDLDLPLAGADEKLAGYLSKYADHVLASLVHGETMRHKVRATTWSLLGDGPPSLVQVAGALRVPARTLQRRLAAEGTSLRKEIDELRRTMAIAVLRDPSIVIDDVAFLLGYSEASTFFRSFKRWTGTTPRRFRNRAA